MKTIRNLLVLLFMTATAAWGQVTTADIVGTVTDSSGAVVANGAATVVNLGTSATQKVSLGASGDYQFTLLPVGTYKVTIQAQGFKTFVSQVTLAAGDRARVNAQLSLGQTTETVTVEATTPALQSQDATVGTLITSELTQDLPLDGRNVTNLITLSAGVTGGLSNALNSGTRPDDRRPSSSFAANGQSDQVNNNLIDGMDNNERSIGSVGVRPSIDAIEEVRVLTNLYSAEISRSGGGVVDLITKAGTNQFHGTLYEFLRNDITDARTYFATIGPKPELRQNQFGGSIGGPIKKDKAFFFFDYEDYRRVLGVTALDTVPTLYEQQNPGDFTDLPGGATCTNVSSQVSKTSIGYSLFQIYPKPNVPGATSPGGCSPVANNYEFSAGQTQYVATYDGKVDYRFSTKNSMYARYTYNDVSTYIPGLLPKTTIDGVAVDPGGGFFGAAGGNEFAGPALDKEMSGAINFTSLLTSNLILDLKAQYMGLNNKSESVNQGTDVATKIGFPCNSTSCVNVPGLAPSSGLPAFWFTQGYTDFGDAGYVPLQDKNNTFQYAVDLSRIKGTQNVKAGASVIRRQVTVGQSSLPRGLLIEYSALHSGNDLADMLLGYAAGAYRGNTLVISGLRQWELGYFVQDDWRVKPNLTLNLGIRYDVYTPYTSSNYGISNLDPKTGLLIGPGLPGPQQSGPTAGVGTDYGDIAPRLGFDYSVRPTLVVRGGYGITFFPGNNTSESYMRNAPYSFTFGCGLLDFLGSTAPCPTAYAFPGDPFGSFDFNAGFPVPSSNMALATDPLNYYGTTINATALDFKASMLQQYSLNVEKDLRGNVVTLAYVGNHGNRLVLNGANQNQRPYAGAAYPFAQIWPQTTSSGAMLASGITVNIRETVLRSAYDAFQATLQRRMKGGLATNVNYTWSHNLTNAQALDEGQAVGNCVGQCHVDDGHGNAVTENSYFQYDYGNADLDTRHRFALTMTYNLPFGKNLTGPRAYPVKGWTANAIYFAQTGNPLTIQNSSGTQSGIGLGNDRPNMVRASGSGFHKGPGEWFDVTQFKLQGAGLLGNERRNQIYGPGTQALNFSIFKTFPLRESINLEFRAESFNLLNTPTFSAPNATIASYDPNGIATQGGGFGQITGTPVSAPAREFQFALKLQF